MNQEDSHPFEYIIFLIRKRRRDLNLSQEKLAKMSKIHVNWIQKIEGNACNPSFGSICLICDALGIKILFEVKQNETH